MGCARIWGWEGLIAGGMKSLIRVQMMCTARHGPEIDSRLCSAGALAVLHAAWQ